VSFCCSPLDCSKTLFIPGDSQKPTGLVLQQFNEKQKKREETGIFLTLPF